MSDKRLLSTPRFAPLFWTQFLGAFNDNVYKNALVVAVAFGALDEHLRSSKQLGMLINFSAALFILPFFLFSATAGSLADKLEKSRLIRRIKLLECGIMALAAIGFMLHSLPLLLTVLFLMGTQSALFGPVKYSILPQHLREEELVAGNGLIEMGTFAAIVLGTLVGTQLDLSYVGLAVLLVAAAGVASAWRIPIAQGDPSLMLSWNIVRDTARMIGHARAERSVFLSILGISWFWFYGAMLLAQFPSLAEEVLHGDRGVVAVLLTVFSLGIGIGSLLCERLSGEIVELGLVPLGSIGLTLFGVDLYFAFEAAAATGTPLTAADMLGATALRVAVDLVLLGLFGGIYIVPLYSMMLQRSKPAVRSRIVAANNILNALFIVAAAGMAIGLRAIGLGLTELILVTAILNAAVAIYIYTLLPEFLMRFLIWILVHTVYRVRATGLEHIPRQGAAVLVCNHVSFVDAPILAAVCRRPIRFVMDHRIFKTPVLNFIFRTGRAIPIAPRGQDEELMQRAFDLIAEALEAGDLVCIYPEGKITKTGELNTFRAGIERIIERTPAVVVPLAIDGLWGSFFSRRHGAAMMSRPRRFYSRLNVRCGSAMEPQEVTAPVLQQRVAALLDPSETAQGLS
jgi:1-acyl-sn-glycerol-3-phosphate acyltransferase